MTDLKLDKQSHTGKQLAETFEGVLKEFYGCNKVQLSFK